MRRIAIIPARSGSKGLKDKNIKLLCGKPLIYYSIKEALDSEAFDKVFVSTDSKEYANISEDCGADASFLRSAKTSSDKASTWDAVREVLAELEKRGEYFDEIMVLQVTSPLRNKEDIINSINLFYDKRADAVVSMTEMEHSPLWSNTLPSDLSMDDFDDPKFADVPRQALPKYYRYNGAIYLLKKSELEEPQMFKKNSYAYIMPQNRSIDIDTELDFKIAEILMKDTL